MSSPTSRLLPVFVLNSPKRIQSRRILSICLISLPLRHAKIGLYIPLHQSPHVSFKTDALIVQIELKRIWPEKLRSEAQNREPRASLPTCRSSPELYHVRRPPHHHHCQEPHAISPTTEDDAHDLKEASRTSSTTYPGQGSN